ncbi:hypothetical protein Q7P37_008945 [Cladosporium fusiforme]
MSKPLCIPILLGFACVKSIIRIFADVKVLPRFAARRGPRLRYVLAMTHSTALTFTAVPSSQSKRDSTHPVECALIQSSTPELTPVGSVSLYVHTYLPFAVALPTVRQATPEPRTGLLECIRLALYTPSVFPEDSGTQTLSQYRFATRPPSRGSSVTRPAQAHRGTPNKQESKFFGLPREIRDNIYRRVLYVSHPLYLFQDTGSQVETFAPDRPHRWLTLLQVNRQIHVEAAETLFGVNHFALLDEKRPKQDLLEAFLTCIGAANSASLSHLSVDFPGLECSAEGLKIKDDSLKRLKLLQEFCTNLKTLEISFSVKHVRELDQVTAAGYFITVYDHREGDWAKTSSFGDGLYADFGLDHPACVWEPLKVKKRTAKQQEARYSHGIVHIRM